MSLKIKKYRRSEKHLSLYDVEMAISHYQLNDYNVIYCDEVYYLFWDREDS